MMKILHIHSKDDAQQAQYVSLLRNVMANDVETASIDDLRTAGQLYSDYRPDIVHVHGKVDFSWPDDARIVITPHGQKVGSRAYVVIARSPLEQEQLHTDHQRVVVIRNPIITRTTTPEELGARTLAVYRQVMDSNVLPLMDDDTLQAMHLLLKIGITGDCRWIGSATIPTKVDWRKLSLYAHYEGITEFLNRGIRLANINKPLYDVIGVPVFLPDNYQRPMPMSADTLTTLITHAAKEPTNMLRLAEIHQGLMRPNIDEDTLLKRLEANKLLPFFSSLLFLLKEQTLLDEGFMPCIPADNRRTEQLRTTLKNHLKI